MCARWSWGDPCPRRPPAAQRLCRLPECPRPAVPAVRRRLRPPLPASAGPGSGRPASAGGHRRVRRRGADVPAGLQGAVPTRPHRRARGGAGHGGRGGAGPPAGGRAGARAGALDGGRGPAAGWPARAPVGPRRRPRAAPRRHRDGGAAGPAGHRAAAGHVGSHGRPASRLVRPVRGGRPVVGPVAGRGRRHVAARRRPGDHRQHARRRRRCAAGVRGPRGWRRGGGRHGTSTRSASRRARRVSIEVSRIGANAPLSSDSRSSDDPGK